MSSDQHDVVYPVSSSSSADAARLRQMQPIIKEAMGNRLVFAPLDFRTGGRRILDSCTSDGYWLFDLREDVGKDCRHQFVGTDIDGSRFPAKCPEDVAFHVQDVRQPWPVSWKSSFDLVHQRFGLIGGGSNPEQAVSSLLELVRPGGWAQLIEPDYVFADDDGPAVRQYLGLIKEIFASMGVPADGSRKVSEWLRKAGFESIQEQLVPVYIGEKIPNAALRERSVDSILVAAEGIVAHVKRSFADGCQTMTPAELGSLASRLGEELRKQGCYYPIRVTWGRKRKGA